MAQNLNPNSDNAQSQWALTGAISRSVALSDASDSSYVQAANTTQVLKLGLTSPGGVPGSLKNWKISFRGRSISSAVTLILKLVINDVVKVTYTQGSIPVSFSLSDYSYTLTFSEAASIDEDIDNVELWLSRSPGTGSIRVVKTQVQVADVTPSSRISSAEARGLSGPIPILNPVAEARSFSGPILISLPTTQARAESAKPLVSMISPSARALSNQVLSNLPAAEGRAESFAPLRVLSVALARAESFAFSFPLDSAKARASALPLFSPVPTTMAHATAESILQALRFVEARSSAQPIIQVLEAPGARASAQPILEALRTPEAQAFSVPPISFEVPTASARAFAESIIEVLKPSEASASSFPPLSVMDTSQSLASAQALLQALETPQGGAVSFPPILFEVPTAAARAFALELIQRVSTPSARGESIEPLGTLASSESRASAESILQALQTPQSRAFSIPPLLFFEMPTPSARAFSEALQQFLQTAQSRALTYEPEDTSLFVFEGIPGVGRSCRIFLFSPTSRRQFFKSDRAMTFSATQRLQEFPFVPGEIHTLSIPMSHIDGDHTGAVFAVESIAPVGTFVANVVGAYQEGCKIGAIQISGGDLSQAAGYIVTVSLELPAKNNDKVYRCLKFPPVPCVG